MNHIVIAASLALVLIAAGSNDSEISGRASGDALELHGSRGSEGRDAAPARSHEPYVYKRLPATVCGTEGADPSSSVTVCVEGIESMPRDRFCEDGARALDPLYRRAVDTATGAYVDAQWTQVDNGGCPEDPSPEIVLSAEEFRRLPLTAPDPVIQPGDGRALVGLGVAGHVDPAPQTLATVVLGVPVQVRATPVQYAWDFGDSTPVVVTTAAGGPWPDHAALGEYQRAGTYDLRLTTTWRGEFQVNGAGPWLAVTGTATTASAPVTITVETAPARLVSEP